MAIRNFTNDGKGLNINISLRNDVIGGLSLKQYEKVHVHMEWKGALWPHQEVFLKTKVA